MFKKGSYFQQIFTLCQENNAQFISFPDLKTRKVRQKVKTLPHWILPSSQPEFLLTLQGKSLAINLPDQSLCLFDGKKIPHETTPQLQPNRLTPKRTSLVFFRCVTKPMCLFLCLFHCNQLKSTNPCRHNGLTRPHHGQDNGGPDSKTAGEFLLQVAKGCRSLIQHQELNQREREILSLLCSAIVNNLSVK